MPTGHLLAFVVTAFVIIVIPGPSVMFIVGRALALDKRAALCSVLGNTVGEYLQVVIVAVGLGLLLQRSVVAFETVKLLGATYLVWLGIGAWRRRGDLESALSAGANASGTASDAGGLRDKGSPSAQPIRRRLSSFRPSFLNSSTRRVETCLSRSSY
jgi:threonine/homoserine/homoserine lactone efflux protein